MPPARSSEQVNPNDNTKLPSDKVGNVSTDALRGQAADLFSQQRLTPSGDNSAKLHSLGFPGLSIDNGQCSQRATENKAPNTHDGGNTALNTPDAVNKAPGNGPDAGNRAGDKGPDGGNKAQDKGPDAGNKAPDNAPDAAARDKALDTTYGARSQYKYAGLSDDQIKSYRSLDQYGPGGPGGKGWDAAVGASKPATDAEGALKGAFDKMKADNEKSGAKPSEPQMKELDRLNKGFIDTLRQAYPAKDYPQYQDQLNKLEALYAQRNRDLFAKKGGSSSDM